jgi:hypothetical protein
MGKEVIIWAKGTSKPVQSHEYGHEQVDPIGGVSAMNTWREYSRIGLIGVTPTPSPVSVGILQKNSIWDYALRLRISIQVNWRVEVLEYNARMNKKSENPKHSSVTSIRPWVLEQQ